MSFAQGESLYGRSYLRGLTPFWVPHKGFARLQEAVMYAALKELTIGTHSNELSLYTAL